MPPFAAFSTFRNVLQMSTMQLDPANFRFAAERGPVDPEKVKELLKPEVLQDSIDKFGYVWLYAVSKYCPDELYNDKELCQLLVAWGLCVPLRPSAADSCAS